MDKAKRYALFAGEYYYPKPGIEDLIGTYDTVGEAKVAMGLRKQAARTASEAVEWAHVVDTLTMTKVCEISFEPWLPGQPNGKWTSCAE